MKINISYSKPSRFSIDKFGSMRKVLVSGSYVYYIQTNKDKNKPRWVEISKFFEEIFIKYAEDDRFVNNCLELFFGKENYLKIKE